MSSDQNASLRRDLARLVGSESVLQPGDYGPYTHDATIQRGLSGAPDAVVCPPNPQTLTELVAWCYAHDLPIVPRGGGSGLSGGAVPVQGGVVCGLERLNCVLSIDPGLWRLKVQAGVSTAHVRRLARENGLLFGPDPGAAEQSLIGGNLATNAAGPHGFKYGPTGDWVIGVDVVLAPGELVSFGGDAAQGRRWLRHTQAARGQRGHARDHHGRAAEIVPRTAERAARGDLPRRSRRWSARLAGIARKRSATGGSRLPR